MEDRLKKQMEFILEADKLKKIGRQTYLSDASRKENDAEHSWHLALMTLLLAEHANSEIDVVKVLTMVLIHDIVEIDAGDTYAYDETAKLSQRDREEKAADRLFGLLPEDQTKKFREIWEEFEARETTEALFARALDNAQPIMLNAATDGRAWREHEVRLEQILKRNEVTPKGSENIWEYMKELIMNNVKKGNIIN